jgi:ATP-dependent DNA helicase RecG
LIADIFQKMHIVEKWGTGIQRIFTVCQEAGIAVPEYIVEDGSVRVNFYRQSLDKKTSDNDDGVSDSSTTHDTTHDEARTEQILKFCAVPRNRTEIQEYVGIKNRSYFQKEVLKPLLDSGNLYLTLPDKPQSKKQQYIAKQNKDLKK